MSDTASLPSPGRRVRDLLSVLALSAEVQLRARWSPPVYVLGIIQPSSFIIVTLLARRPGSAIDPAAVALGAGLVSLWATTIWTSGLVLRGERWQGTLSPILARPTSLVTVLIGKTLGATLQSAALIGVTVFCVTAAFGHAITPARPLAFVATLAAVLVSASVLGMLLGSLFVLTRAADRVSEALMYPVFILGGLIVPISLLPQWAQPISWIVSLRWGGELLRAAERGDPLQAEAWLLLALTTAAYAVLARFAFKRVLELARREGTLDLY